MVARRYIAAMAGTLCTQIALLNQVASDAWRAVLLCSLYPRVALFAQ